MNCPSCKKPIRAFTGLQEAVKYSQHLTKCKKRPSGQRCDLNASTHFDESRAKIMALENHLRAIVEHIAPMLKLYEPNLPEHPVIAAIRDYLEKP